MRERVVSRGGAGKGGHCPMGQCRLAGWPHDRFPPPGSGPSMRRTMRPGRLAHLLLGTPRPLLPSSAQRSRNHLEASSRPETAAGGQGLGVGALLASFRRDPSPQAAHRVARGTAPAASAPRRAQERAPACVPLACPLPALARACRAAEASAGAAPGSNWAPHPSRPLSAASAARRRSPSMLASGPAPCFTCFQTATHLPSIMMMRRQAAALLLLALCASAGAADDAGFCEGAAEAGAGAAGAWEMLPADLDDLLSSLPEDLVNATIQARKQRCRLGVPREPPPPPSRQDRLARPPTDHPLLPLAAMRRPWTRATSQASPRPLTRCPPTRPGFTASRASARSRSRGASRRRPTRRRSNCAWTLSASTQSTRTMPP